MKTYQVAFLSLAFVAVGCKPNAERQKQASLKQFQNLMEKRDAAVTLGMARPDVIAALGDPFWTTNTSGSKNQIVDIYQFQPPVQHWGVLTNGFEIFFSNNVVVQKSPIKGISR